MHEVWGDEPIKPSKDGSYLLNKNESYVLELGGKPVWSSSKYYGDAPMAKVIAICTKTVVKLI